MKYHFTVKQQLAAGCKHAQTFIVEVDPERLVLLRGARALKARRGTAVLARGAIKILALVKQHQGQETAELEL